MAFVLAAVFGISADAVAASTAPLVSRRAVVTAPKPAADRSPVIPEPAIPGKAASPVQVTKTGAGTGTETGAGTGTTKPPRKDPPNAAIHRLDATPTPAGVGRRGAKPDATRPAIARPADAPPTNVQSASLSLTTTAAGAADVTYVVSFTTSDTGALTQNQDDIVVAAPAGTVFGSQCEWDLYDLTSNQGSYANTCASNIGSGDDSSTLTAPISFDIAAGDQVQIVFTGVTNAPDPGPATVVVSTSVDTATVDLAATLTAPQPLAEVGAVTLSTNAAGADAVSYSFDFTTSSTGDLEQGGQLFVTAPEGTDLAGDQYQDSPSLWTFNDLTNGNSDSVNPDQGAAGADPDAVSITVPFEINAGDQVQVTAGGVTNPSTLGPLTLQLSTTSDIPATSTPAYQLTAAGTISQVTPVTLSTTSAGASEVSYNFGFTVSATGGLAADEGYVTVTAPAGTDFFGGDPSEGTDWTFTDTTTGESSDTGVDAAPGQSGTVAQALVPITINAGDSIQITAGGVTSPSTVGSDYTLTLSTSSDPATVTTPAYALTAPGTVSDVTPVTLTTTAAGASEVTYQFGFTASTSGALAAQEGEILVVAPVGTDFYTGQNTASAPLVTVTDITTGQSGSTLSEIGPPGGGDAAAAYAISVPIQINGGDQIQVSIPAVTSPSMAGSDYALTVSTTSDPATVQTPDFSLTAPAAVSAPSLSITSPAAGAITQYTVDLTASATGALDQNNGTITFAASSGTDFTFQPQEAFETSYTVTDETTGAANTGYVDEFYMNSADGGATVTFPALIPVAPGDQVQVVWDGALNPAAAQPAALMLSTSSDTVPTELDYAIAPAASVSAASVALGVTSAGSQTTYSFGFTASADGALAAHQGAILLTAPVGTYLPQEFSALYYVYDQTTGQLGESSLIITGGNEGSPNQGSVIVPIGIADGDQVVLTLHGVVNPAVGGPETLSLSTTSDTIPVSLPYTVTGTTSGSDAGLSVSTAAATAQEVDYTATLTTSPTGGLTADNGSVDLTGTLPGQFTHADHATVNDLTTHSGNESGEVYPAPNGVGAEVVVPIDIADGDQVSFTIDGVANPAAPGPEDFTVATSADPIPLPVSATFTAPAAVTGAEVQLSHNQATNPDTQYTIGFATSATQGALTQDGTFEVTAPPGTVFPNGEFDYCLQIGGASNCSYVPYNVGSNPDQVELYPTAVPAGTPMVLTITDVENATTAGPQNLAITTSSDTVPAQASYQLGPVATAAITGKVSDQGNPSSGSILLFCPDQGTTGSCFSDTTDSSGEFYDPVQLGNYAVTADPVTGSHSEAATVQVTTTVQEPIATEQIMLTLPGGLPSGATLSNPDTGSSPAGAVPTVYWGTPSTYSVTGEPTGGIGLMVVTAVNTQTGATEQTPVVLTETPPGSGTYSGVIPALVPEHGPASVSTMILPAPAVAPKRTDQSCGASGGGGRIMANLAGSGAVSQILFGTVPGTGLEEVDAGGLYSVIPPAGTGTVEMTAATAGGSVDLGSWCYVGLGATGSGNALSSTSGPQTGGGTITVTASNLGPNPDFIFNNAPSNQVTQTGSDTYSVSVPPGTGSGQVTAAIPGGGMVPVGIYNYTGNDGASAMEALYETYFEVDEWGLKYLDFASAVYGEPEGVAGVLSDAIEPLITMATGYKFTSGPAGLLLSAFGTELLLGGLGGIMTYLLLLYLTSQLDKALLNFFSMLIDPSGTVVDTSGDPVPGATVTLEAPTGPGGAYEPVAAQSPGIQPNINPETTDTNGIFDWNAAAGTYRVVATSDTCLTAQGAPATADSTAFTLPPPAIGLVITLPCQLGTADPPQINALEPPDLPAAGGPVTVTGPRVGAATSVTVNGAQVPFTAVDSGTLLITAPAGNGIEQVVVTTPAGPDTSQSGDDELDYAIPTTVSLPAPTVSVTAATPNPSVSGQNVTFTAQVAAPGAGGAVPTGTVTFTVDGTPQSPVALNSAGKASLKVSTLMAGVHSVVAVYSGDANYAAANSPALTQTVNQAATTVTLTSSVNPAVYGQSVAFNAVVLAASPGAGTPTGTVTFTVNGTAQSPIPLDSGKSATLKLSTLTPGQYTVTASYSGDPNYTASSSSSPALTETVGQASTTVSLGSSANPSTAGGTIAFTVTVAATGPGSGSPTGTVTLIIDGVAQAPVTLGTGKSVTIKISTLSHGSHSITVSYSGDPDFAASTSSTLTQTVN